MNDASTNGNHSNMFSMTWRSRGGRDLFRNFMVSNDRPNTTFVKGVYNTSVQSINVLDSTSIPANTVIHYTVSNNSIVPIDTNYYWAAGGYTYLYDEAGLKLDSTLISATNILNISQIGYYEKRPMTIELINFITPYGKGLDLNGLTGKTWEFDVTDYATILKGRKFMAMESGKYQEDNDITFVFYEGIPTRKVKSLQQIWPCAVWKDASSTAILNNTIFEPRNLQLSPDASLFKIRSAISGHGQEGEFIPRNHTITINSTMYIARSVSPAAAVLPAAGTI